MFELEAGPRQMSRVSGLSYGIIQYIMDHGDRLFRRADHEVHDIADGRYDGRIQKFQQGLTR